MRAARRLTYLAEFFADRVTLFAARGVSALDPIGFCEGGEVRPLGRGAMARGRTQSWPTPRRRRRAVQGGLSSSSIAIHSVPSLCPWLAWPGRPSSAVAALAARSGTRKAAAGSLATRLEAISPPQFSLEWRRTGVGATQLHTLSPARGGLAATVIPKPD